MTSGYTKLFGSIIASTVWQEPNHVRIVWITLLALRNRYHVVEASVPGLASLARVTVEECREAIRKFEAPDPDSRSPEYEGRRIEKVDGGWKILNGEKYRRKMSADERKEYQRVYQRGYRKRKADHLPGEDACIALQNAGVDVSASDFLHLKTKSGPQ